VTSRLKTMEVKMMPAADTPKSKAVVLGVLMFFPFA
jgi:hypothetical protein